MQGRPVPVPVHPCALLKDTAGKAQLSRVQSWVPRNKQGVRITNRDIDNAASVESASSSPFLSVAWPWPPCP
ncbi:hypothetical protein NXS19_010543 [Fusarium pseudograminearum]|nr:hypothetical protein NXS19_010543 [Fusarium pseudograminearum]